MGLEHDDFLAAMAPKPVIIMAQERDYFDARGSEFAYQNLKKLYGLLGAEQKVQLHVGPDEHGYSRPNREAMYGFFNKQTKVAEGNAEPQLVIEKDETLLVMPHGQVSEVPSRTVLDFTRDTATSLAKARATLKGDALRSAIVEVLRLPKDRSEISYRILRGISGRKYPLSNFTNYAVTTEPGIEAIVTRLSAKPHISRPTRGLPECTLYVSHHSADAELRGDAWVADMVKAAGEQPFYAVDVRGIGDSRPDTCGGSSTYLGPYGNDYFYAAHGVMLDRPYPGQRTLDLLQVLDWLKSVGHQRVHLVANGWGAIPTTFAAVLSPLVTQVTLRHALTSYHAVATAEHYSWPLSSFVPDILKHFDLPDCYAALADKKTATDRTVGCGW